MPSIFEPADLGPLRPANRFVRSATWEGLADEAGLCTPALTACMAELARGGVGLIISGHAYVTKVGQAGPQQLAADGDRCLEGLTAMAEAVHREGSLMALQLAHAGSLANEKVSGLFPLGPSVIKDDDGVPKNDQLSIAQIDETVAAFGRAAALAKRAGLDAVQIHAAHGYLISQFLSPHFNNRDDEYGGDLLGRARLLLEVVEAVRKAVGDDYPVLVKMNSQDFLDDGLSEDEAVQVAARLMNQGIDALELSGGTIASGKRIPIRMGRFDSFESEGWYKETAKRIRAELGMTLILVGGLRSPKTAERLVSEGYCDFISLSRPLIREPGLIKRWADGDLAPSACVSDNLCFRPAMAGQGIYCLTAERERKE